MTRDSSHHFQQNKKITTTKSIFLSNHSVREDKDH